MDASSQLRANMNILVTKCNLIEQDHCTGKTGSAEIDPPLWLAWEIYHFYLQYYAYFFHEYSFTATFVLIFFCCILWNATVKL